MERKIVKLILLLVTISSAYGNYSEKFYNYFVNDKMSEWKILVDDMDKVSPKSNEFRLELVNYQYGYIAWCIGKKRNSEAEKYLEKADDNLNLLEKNKYGLSMVYAYRAAFYGFRIGLSRWRAPFLGPKSIDNAELSVKTDSKNWFAYMQLGNIDFYTPSIMGGSKSDALKHYIKAEKLIESSADKGRNWNYLNLLTVIGKSYFEMNNFDLAKKYYDKTLEIEPNYFWVKEELYPILLNKMKGK